MYVRVEISPCSEFGDPQAEAFLRALELSAPELRHRVKSVASNDCYWLQFCDGLEPNRVRAALAEVFHDPILQQLVLAPEDLAPRLLLEKRYRAGVTDNVGRSTHEALAIVLGTDAVVRAASGAGLVIQAEWSEAEWKRAAESVFCNPLIEAWKRHSHVEAAGRFTAVEVARAWPEPRAHGEQETARVETVALAGLSDAALEALSRDRLWALTVEELRAVREHFASQQRVPTDVEVEVIAQTWSEHCKHKIFAAEVKYSDRTGGELGREIPAHIQSLFKSTIAATTKELPRPWLLSVFSDNAGIVAIDDETAVCIKVETHNSPSALDPYGGALTGIVGVNRDILGCGLGARPLFNTDVFCTAEIDYREELPERLMHPRRILEGVRRGVEHGGNKSGIPTLNGALMFDERYLGKPLVYCGTGGVMPRMIGGRPCETKEIHPGDRIVMVGGRIGKDGIHGATFSSLALDESSPVTAVQLGDPITQKKMSDFLLEARDLGLYRALTDNGAGGLSSSVGELAQLTGGATFDVSLAPVKYPGLLPFERVISESQERMTLAVPPEQLGAFLALSRRRGVESTDLGAFDRSGFFQILFEGKTVAKLDLKFLHEGCPRLRLQAEWSKLEISTEAGRAPAGENERHFRETGKDVLLDLLGRPNIASKEWLIRQYDHEVQGRSVVKPLHQAEFGGTRRSGPNDAGVVTVRDGSNVGVVIGCGLAPRLGDHDPYVMAQASVDEAIRNILAAGAEFGTPDCVVSLCDNFCWPDPVKDPRKMAALVRACYGMRNAAIELGVPLVSGKDSMKNDYRGKLGAHEVQISVPFTLLMTALARVPDIRRARTSNFQHADEVIYRLGWSESGLAASEWEQVARGRVELEGVSRRVPHANWEVARATYSWLGGTRGRGQEWLRAVHDISEGGLYTALVESALARGLGVHLEHAEEKGDRIWEWAFGEGFHAFVVSTASEQAMRLEGEWRAAGVPFERIGRTTLDGRFQDHEIDVAMEECYRAWHREGYWQ